MRLKLELWTGHKGSRASLLPKKKFRPKVWPAHVEEARALFGAARVKRDPDLRRRVREHVAQCRERWQGPPVMIRMLRHRTRKLAREAEHFDYRQGMKQFILDARSYNQDP